ncbi:MAG: glycosyltransferase [Bacillota bacterium]|nr:glycosyltransferase [Bacillota bacterium]
MKSVLLYYPFKLAENANSGSKLRPKKIYSAFQEWGSENGIEILLLSGSSSERQTQFNSLRAEGKLDDLLFCYMENQTIPFWLTDAGHIPKKPFIDLQVMKFLKRKKVPTGVFYRDVYWKFDELYSLKGIKKTVMKSIYRMEEKFYEKYCDIIFLPSDAMGQYVDINKRKVALPPGGTENIDHESSLLITGNRVAVENREWKSNGMYVGGINNDDYGLFLLLDALELANRDDKVCKLTVVCREDEYNNLPDNKKLRLSSLHVSVKHVSGNALNDLYKEMDYAFIPRFKSTYNDFSVPVKLVEYLSNELPVVATNCAAQRDIIESDSYGIICEDNAASMAEAIEVMSEQSAQFRANIQATFTEKHSWKSRVERIKESLL